MPDIPLKVDDLILDQDNPRITHAEGQQEALQKVVANQRTKLVKLAQSVAEHGLNPMDRLLVLRVHQKPERFIALEGNRRVAVFKMLTNPTVMTGLDMPPPMRKILTRLADNFSKSKIEPISCFELPARQDGDYWLRLRHKGEQQGAGIVGWTGIQSARYDKRSPALQAFEMVMERGGLPPDQVAKISERFPLVPLQRFVEDRKARAALGLDVKEGKLITNLPASEVIKPLRKLVTDIANKDLKVGQMKTDEMVAYVNKMDKRSQPDFSKVRKAWRTIDEIPISEFSKPARAATPRRKPDPSDRREVVPKGCPINVTDNRIAEIYRELRTLRLDDAPNAIAVLLRVFLEMSVDYFLEANKIPLRAKNPDGGTRLKKLDKKLTETIDILVKIGVPRTQLAAVARSLSVAHSPFNIELFHLYVHERFATPSPAELKAAWNNAQPLFERIWP